MGVLFVALLANLSVLAALDLPALPRPLPPDEEGQKEDLEALAFKKKGTEWSAVAGEWDCELVSDPKWRKLCAQWATMHDKVNAYLDYVDFRRQAKGSNGDDREGLTHLAAKPYIAKSTDGSKNAQRNVDRALEEVAQEAERVSHFRKRWAYVPLHEAMAQILRAHADLFDGAKKANKEWRRTIHVRLTQMPILVLVNKTLIVDVEAMVFMYRSNKVQTESDSEELSEQERAFRADLLADNLRFIKGAVDSSKGYMLWLTPEQNAYLDQFDDTFMEAFEIKRAANEFGKSQDGYIDKVARDEKER